MELARRSPLIGMFPLRAWLLASALIASAAADPRIEHVVLLVMENRPLDMFFGWAQKELNGVDGLSGNESNLYDTDDPSKGSEWVQRGHANYVCQHSSRMSHKIYKGDFFGSGSWNGTRPYPEPNNGGFLQENKGNAEIMWQFSPEQVPVKMALAREFALVDRYYSSFPGPSTPNHLFLHSATAAGCTETGADYQCERGKTFPQTTIYERLLEKNLSWSYFYNDSAWISFIDFFNTPQGKAGLRSYDEFYYRASEGTLPNYSWIFPRQGINRTTHQGPNDDHPCHDVALGERLLKDTYEALRAGPGWNRTLLMVTYDDAGGWYDHVPPVVGVPPPDDERSCPDSTDFSWTGGRVPMLLISPWISRGRVIHGPSGRPGTVSRPAANSVYEHSSVPATLKNLFNLSSFLTRRDAWAGSFHAEFTESRPRADTPQWLPDAPPPSTELGLHGACEPGQLTRRQKRRLQQWAHTNAVSVPPGAASSPDAAEEWILKQFRSWLHGGGGGRGGGERSGGGAEEFLQIVS